VKKLHVSLVLVLITFSAWSQKIWTTDQAKEWYNKQLWLIGCNFIPSTAINELEMWQAYT